MKSCTHCNNMLIADDNYCYKCDTAQTGVFDEFELKVKPKIIFLKILCILTIMGAVSGIASVPLSFILLDMNIDFVHFFDIVFIIGITIALAKLTGAIFMLRRKRIGLYIYTGAGVASIIASIHTAITLPSTVSIYGILGSVFGLFFVLLFLVMFWLPVNRRALS